MTLAESVKTCFRKYFIFSGRGSRSEFWWFVLFTTLVSTTLNIVDSIVFDVAIQEVMDPHIGGYWRLYLSATFALVILVPFWAAVWRRMHDTGRPGFDVVMPPILSMVGMALLIGLSIILPDFTLLGPNQTGFERLRGILFVVPFALLFLLFFLPLWWLTRPSQPGPNNYGPNPHEHEVPQ